MLIALRLPNIIFLFEFLRSMVFTTAPVPLVVDRNPLAKGSFLYLSVSPARKDFFESLRLPLAKGSSTFSPSPSSSGSGDVTALRCSEPLRYRVGGASKPSPDCAGWDRINIDRKENIRQRWAKENQFSSSK